MCLISLCALTWPQRIPPQLIWLPRSHRNISSVEYSTLEIWQWDLLIYFHKPEEFMFDVPFCQEDGATMIYDDRDASSGDSWRYELRSWASKHLRDNRMNWNVLTQRYLMPNSRTGRRVVFILFRVPSLRIIITRTFFSVRTKIKKLWKDLFVTARHWSWHSFRVIWQIIVQKK